MSVRVLGGIGVAALQLKPYRTAGSTPITGRYNRVTYCAVSSTGENTREPKMDQEKQTRPQAEHDESKTHTDVMTDSFGEGYSTRSDDEGFGGIYGGNDPVMNPGLHVNHPDYDKSQGSEVKEKEKARNLKHGAHTV